MCFCKVEVIFLLPLLRQKKGKHSTNAELELRGSSTGRNDLVSYHASVSYSFSNFNRKDPRVAQKMVNR